MHPKLDSIFSLKVSIAMFIGACSAWLAELQPMIRLLLLLTIVDFVTGLLCAATFKELSSQVSFRGIVKKVLMFILCAVCHLISEPLHIGIDLALAAGGFFCVTEFLSIVENCHAAGVPIPPVVTSTLVKLRTVADTDRSTENQTGEEK